MQNAEALSLDRGVYTMGATGRSGEIILWAVDRHGRRVAEFEVPSEVPAQPEQPAWRTLYRPPTAEGLLEQATETLWELLEAMDPNSSPTPARTRRPALSLVR